MRAVIPGRTRTVLLGALTLLLAAAAVVTAVRAVRDQSPQLRVAAATVGFPARGALLGDRGLLDRAAVAWRAEVDRDPDAGPAAEPLDEITVFFAAPVDGA